MHRLLLPLLLLVVALGGPRAARADTPPDIVLISMDTTRADALSCYGEVPGLTHPRPEVTPNLDALAAQGARFARFYAHAPTTLNSHTSMFTGLDPHGHAVPRNGFPVPDGVTTLAERLQAAGYDTIAVLASAALEHGMGLDRGFRVYDDHFDLDIGMMVQDRASGVLGRARADLAGREKGKPLFLFVHFYDAHQPYDPPEPYRSRFEDPAYHGPYGDQARHLGPLRRALLDGTADPADVDEVAALYLGEVAYVDATIGALLDLLGSEGVLDHAVVVVLADHGEVLGELPVHAYTHGDDVSDGAMHIPLIVRGYGVPLAEHAVIHSQAGMAGVAPTLEALAGLAPDLGRGVPFLDLLSPGPIRDEDGWPSRPTRPVVMEATRPHIAAVAPAWNNLDLWRGIRAGGFVVRAYPRFRIGPTLDAAPAGTPDPTDAPMRAVLARLLEAWDATAPPFRAERLSPSTREALERLGYLDGSQDGDDP